MWERILTYEIQPEDAGRTVAEYLRSRGFSRHLLIRLKTMPDGITLDGVPVLPSHRFFFDRVKLWILFLQTLQFFLCMVGTSVIDDKQPTVRACLFHDRMPL